MASPKGNALILRRMAIEGVTDAREAWRRMRKNPDERRIRAAHVRCVYAARMLRKAAAVLPASAEEMELEAARLDIVIEDLRGQLVRIDLGKRR